MMNDITEFCKRHKKIYIYGAGTHGRIVAEYIREYTDCTINGFVVSKKNEQQILVLGTVVSEVDEIQSELCDYDVGVIVAIGEASQKNVLDVIKNIGVKSYIYVSDNSIPLIEKELKYTFRWNKSNNVNILMYHRVASLNNDYRHMAVDPSLFKKEMKFLKTHYRLAGSMDEWNSGVDTVVLTFDDGYYDFNNIVLPILEEYEIPATVFISTGNIDRNSELWGDYFERLIFEYDGERTSVDYNGLHLCFDNYDERFKSYLLIRSVVKNTDKYTRNNILDELAKLLGVMVVPRNTHRAMSTEEIRACAASSLVTIGAHTVSHCCLAHESIEVQQEEIAASKKVLEGIIDRQVDVFAYPYGEPEDYSDKTKDMAIKLGFKKIFSVKGGLTSTNDKPYNIPRNNVGYIRSIDEFVRKMKYFDVVYGDRYV